MSIPDAVAKRVVKKFENEIGTKRFKTMGKKAASRILGKLAVGSKPWAKAFEHIAKHFGPIADKPSHGIFLKELRNRPAIERLIRTALNRLGRAPVVTRLENVAPSVILEKEFPDVIGVTQKGELCRILRIVVDYTGRPISAFPVPEFYGAAGAVAVLLTASTSQADVPRVKAVEDTYAAEYAEAERRQEAACDRASGGWIGKTIDFLTFDSSCTAVDGPELIRAGELNARANQAVQTIEARTGTPLDDQTQSAVREDVRRIWGWGTPGAE
jgi:hypothetical protein